MHAIGEAEAIARTATAVVPLDALNDDQTGRAKNGHGASRRILGDADAAGDIPNAHGGDPALIAAMGGQGQVLQGGPRQGPQLATPR